MAKKILAVVGATGLVGNYFLKVLQEKNLRFDDYFLFASKKSEGKILSLFGKNYKVNTLTPEAIKNRGITHALFSAGREVSEKYAPLFVREGALVIDNGSRWRLNPLCPLVVPEANIEDALVNRGIIANPNCSTIQAILILKPLDDAFRIKRVIIDTYQSVSGAGIGGIAELENRETSPKVFPKVIYSSVIPQIDEFAENGYTLEELKMINETRKILHRPFLPITATAVRVPVFYCHSESIDIEFETPCEKSDILQTLKKAPGVVVYDNADYPTPFDVEGKDEVFVGRIRKDYSRENAFHFWVVADNLRKGASTNAVQILEYMIKKS